jgi:hypothetical protein
MHIKRLDKQRGVKKDRPLLDTYMFLGAVAK